MAYLWFEWGKKSKMAKPYMYTHVGPFLNHSSTVSTDSSSVGHSKNVHCQKCYVFQNEWWSGVILFPLQWKISLVKQRQMLHKVYCIVTTRKSLAMATQLAFCVQNNFSLNFVLLKLAGWNCPHKDRIMSRPYITKLKLTLEPLFFKLEQLTNSFL